MQYSCRGFTHVQLKSNQLDQLGSRSRLSCSFMSFCTSSDATFVSLNTTVEGRVLPTCHHCVLRLCYFWTRRSGTGGYIRRWVGRIAGKKKEEWHFVNEWNENKSTSSCAKGATDKQAGVDIKRFSALFSAVHSRPLVLHTVSYWTAEADLLWIGKSLVEIYSSRDSLHLFTVLKGFSCKV